MMKGRALSLGSLALLLVLLGGSAWGQVMPNTPRALGMGNAFIAVSNDEGAILANPAGLALIRQGMVAMGSLGLTNLQEYWYSAYAVPPSGGIARATAFSFAKTRNNATNVRSDRMSWSSGQYYAEGVAVGLNLHFLRASNDSTGAEDKAFGLDLGVLYQLPAKPGHESPGTVGVLVQNPNEPTLLGDTLPRVVSVGVATRLLPNLLVAGDSYNVLGEPGAPVERSVGVEFTPLTGISLRGGFMTEASVFTLGAALQGQSFRLDAAWASEDGGDETGYVGMSFLF